MPAAQTTPAKTSQTIPKAGTVAWTRRNPSLWWPCLVYPSWSYAAKTSTLMPQDQPILIQGCRKKIAWHHLSQNMVPLKVALGRNSNKQKKRRFVAHYLGLCGSKGTAQWGAVDCDGILPFRENAGSILLGYRNKLHRDDWKELVRGIEEAAVVLEDGMYHPRSLMADWVDDGTPEFFDDWESQSQGMSMSQQKATFSQAVNFAAASALVDIGKRIDDANSRREEDTKRDNDKTPQIANKRKRTNFVKIMDVPKNMCTNIDKSPEVTIVTPYQSPPHKKQKQLESKEEGVAGCSGDHQSSPARDDVLSTFKTTLPIEGPVISPNDVLTQPE